MRPSGYYVIAGLLVLASLPIYRYVYLRTVRPNVVESSQVDRPRPVVSGSRRLYMTPNEVSAFRAIVSGRARCVAGVVYRTSDHVIEPWPGGVRCVGDGPAATPLQASGL